MNYLLDTNACIRFLKEPNSPVTRRILRTPSSDIYICSIVREELFYGAYKSAQIERNLARLERLFDEFISLPFDDRCGSIAGRVRARLASLGTPIGAYDLQIAAIALANNLILVTHNTREFSRVEGLGFEDWELD